MASLAFLIHYHWKLRILLLVMCIHSFSLTTRQRGLMKTLTLVRMKLELSRAHQESNRHLLHPSVKAQASPSQIITTVEVWISLLEQKQ